MKKIIILLAAIGTMFFSATGVFAAQKIGFVDMTKVLNNYTKAQEITDSIKVQQTEIQRMVADARNQINAAITEEEKTALEKKLSDQIQQRNNEFRADYEKKVQALQDNIVATVKKVAENKRLDFIFRKDNIITGGQDITDAVLAELNK